MERSHPRRAGNDDFNPCPGPAAVRQVASVSRCRVSRMGRRTVYAGTSPANPLAVAPVVAMAPHAPHHVTAIAILPVAQHMLAALGDSRGVVHMFDLGTGAELRSWETAGSTMTQLSFNRTGTRILCVSLDPVVGIYTVADGNIVSTLVGHHAPVLSGEFATVLVLSCVTEIVATGAWDKMVRLWSADTGAPLWCSEPYGGAIVTCRFSPLGCLLVFSLECPGDNTIRVLDASNPALPLLVCESSPAAHPNLDPDLETAASPGWQDFAWSPDGSKIFSCSYDGKCVVYDVSAAKSKFPRVLDAPPIPMGPPIVRCEGHDDQTSHAAWSHCGRYLLSSSWQIDRSIKVWNACTGALLGRVAAMGPVRESIPFAFSPNALVIVTTGRVTDTTTTLRFIDFARVLDQLEWP